MIDHFMLKVRDVEVSKPFYEAVLGAIGFRIIASFEARQAYGFGRKPDKPDFWVEAGGPLRPAIHLAFACDTRELVRAFHAAALGAGARDNGAPGPRPYREHYYGAFVIDPDGHNIEAVCRRPEGS
jgi:catechol 2,3-dioxygenase-like lactoylglutathione lyase family enzyme